MCCVVQSKALEDSKDGKDVPSKLAKLMDSTDPLAWIESSIKTFSQLIGNEHLPLGYVIRKDAAVERDPTDADAQLLPNKCYSEKHGSLRNELIARCTHNDGVYDTNKEIVYNFMREALTGTKWSSILKQHEKSKDGRAVWMALIRNHGGEERWEQSYEKLVKALTRKWKSSADITLESHVGTLKTIFERMDLACEYTSHTPLTEREKVLKLLDSIDNNDAMLTAHIANVNGDHAGKGSNFESCVSHLLLADPVEKKLTKSGTKRSFDALVSGTSALSGRGSTGVDLRWYPNAEYKALSQDQRDELAAWRDTPAGVEAMKAAKKKRKEEQARKNGNGGGGGGKGKGKLNDKDRKKFHKAVKKAAVSMVKTAAKDVVKESAERRKTAIEVASVLKEGEVASVSKEGESTGGGAAKKAVNFSEDSYPPNVKPNFPR